MKIFHKGQDISRFIGKITWSGSRIQAGRKLVFEYLKDTRDPNLPIININPLLFKLILMSVKALVDPPFLLRYSLDTFSNLIIYTHLSISLA